MIIRCSGIGHDFVLNRMFHWEKHNRHLRRACKVNWSLASCTTIPRHIIVIMIDGKSSTGKGQTMPRDGVDIALVDIKDKKTNAVADRIRKIGRKAATFKADVIKGNQVYPAVDHAQKVRGGFNAEKAAESGVSAMSLGPKRRCPCWS